MPLNIRLRRKGAKPKVIVDFPYLSEMIGAVTPAGHEAQLAYEDHEHDRFCRSFVAARGAFCGLVARL